jgi:secondary thiamine-phosphate synthase enzyme
MDVITKTIHIKTKKENDIVDITKHVSAAVAESKLANGNVTVFVSGSTAAVTTIEFEPGLVQDFPKMLSRLAPSDIDYEHQKMWHDDNGHSHVKASLVGPSLTIPFNDGNLFLGTWQQIVVLELDTRPRERQVVLQIIGK